MDDLISRQAAIDALKRFKPEIIPYEKARRYVEETIDTMYNRIEALPTTQPEYRLDEWCMDCKEYDQKKHCCPRFNRVIREAAEEVRQNAQPEPAILLSWVEKYIEWLRSLDNEFANLAAAHISVMVKKWRDEQDERTD